MDSSDITTPSTETCPEPSDTTTPSTKTCPGPIVKPVASCSLVLARLSKKTYIQPTQLSTLDGETKIIEQFRLHCEQKLDQNPAPLTTLDGENLN